MSGFQPWSATHVATLLVCFGAIAGAITLGRRWRRVAPHRERTMRIGWVVALIAVQVFTIIWWLLPVRFDVHISLPLHICDLVVWVAPIALLTRIRWARPVLYFWGTGLSIHAFFMPVLERGPDDVIFWLFWIGHTQIVGSAIYLPAVMAYRPSARELGLVVALTVLYVLLITPFNLWLNTDYGYVGPVDGPSAELGPWPARIVMLLTIEVILFTMLWLPFTVAQRIRIERERSRV